jgi:hypothetical protein
MAILGTNLLWGVFMTLVPYGEWRGMLFLFFMVVTVLELTLVWTWWKNPSMSIVRFNSLTAYTMLVTMGVFSSFPIYSLTWGYVWFLFFLGGIILTLIFSLFKRESLYKAFTGHKDGKTVLLVVIGILVVFFILGGLSSFRGQERIILSSLTDVEKAWYVSLFVYLMGLFLIFISSFLLKKAE